MSTFEKISKAWTKITLIGAIISAFSYGSVKVYLIGQQLDKIEGIVEKQDEVVTELTDLKTSVEFISQSRAEAEILYHEFLDYKTQMQIVMEGYRRDSADLDLLYEDVIYLQEQINELDNR